MDIFRNLFLLSFLVSTYHWANAQPIPLLYDNHIYQNTITTVQLHPIGKESSFPIINLDSDERLNLSFDDLRVDKRDYYISIQHCSATWLPSLLSPLRYSEGYNEERIMDIRSSSGSKQAYVHYQITFPNANIKPKLAGNYLLKVYEDADEENLILTQRFYVVNASAKLEAKIIQSLFKEYKNQQQKLNITCTTSTVLNNPSQELSIHVFQNQRTDNMKIVRQPSSINGMELKYDDLNTLDFKGNNEFRFVDLRSIKSGSAQGKKMIVDTNITLYLFPDYTNAGLSYAASYDHNGATYIRNLDNTQEEISSEYINVIFSLQTSTKINGNIYLVGGFNNYMRNNSNKLVYNTITETWHNHQKLKQGIYDYEYILVDKDNNIITDAFSGNHYATGNNYQILVYQKKTGTHWDEIINFTNISTNK